MDDPELNPLQARAKEFAAELTATVRTVSPQADPFTARLVRERVTVRQEPGEGIPLSVGGEKLFTLKTDLKCCWDSAGQFLTIEEASTAVFAGTSDRQPIFRYEYVREARDVPAAHLHVHAHRDSFTYALVKGGTSSKRAKARSKSSKVPSLADVHFPLGGHRFRPVLEDVLEMLIDEFGVDHESDALQTLAEARQRWRETQTKAAVRDAPDAAIESLRSMGYTVEWAGSKEVPLPRVSRLQAR